MKNKKQIINTDPQGTNGTFQTCLQALDAIPSKNKHKIMTKQDGKPYKASDIERDWGKDLFKRGVLTPNKNIEGWELEYCEKFGLCDEEMPCQCKAELKFIKDLLHQQKGELAAEIMTLINREIAIAHTKDKGGKTSRLTSLAMKVSSLLKR